MISAVVLTKNEEVNIKECLAGLKWCDEILVIDDDSSDATRELAEKEGAKVIKHALAGDFAAQRNFALEKASGDWVFFVDADERVSPELVQEIQEAIKSPDTEGYCLKRIDFFMGKWLKHGEIRSVKLLRLGKRKSGSWQRSVDEVWEIKGNTRVLQNPLLHYSHPELKQFLSSINERTTLNAKEFYKRGVKVTFFEWLKPLAKFIKNYFLLLGFLDGTSGLVFAVMMSLHSFMVRGKLYLLWEKNEK
jgi:glycosyltransferase involved in cell wall biosynthesis